MQAGDAEHDVVDAVAFEAAVAEDFPGLHLGEDVLDTAEARAVFVLPVGQFVLAAFAAVRDEDPGATPARTRAKRGSTNSHSSSDRSPRIMPSCLPQTADPRGRKDPNVIRTQNRP